MLIFFTLKVDKNTGCHRYFLQRIFLESVFCCISSLIVLTQNFAVCWEKYLKNSSKLHCFFYFVAYA